MKHLLFIVLFFVAPSSPAWAECKRWLAPQTLNPCWGIVAQDVCSDTSQSTWSDAQKHNWNKWKYASTSNKACTKFAMKYGWYLGRDLLPTKTEEYVTNGELRARCYGTNHEVGSPNYGQFEEITNQVRQEVVTPEPCCSRTPNGPYKDMMAPFFIATVGGDFSSAVKNAAASFNRTAYGVNDMFLVLSDVWMHMTIPDGGSNGELVWGSTSPDDPEFDPDTFHIPSLTLAHVDHIVPRIDTYGCPCGKNSKGNALIISDKLNTQMSNRCSHPMRQAILDKFAPM